MEGGWLCVVDEGGRVLWMREDGRVWRREGV